MIDAIFAGADYKVCDPCPANIITEAWYQKLYPNGRKPDFSNATLLRNTNS